MGCQISIFNDLLPRHVFPINLYRVAYKWRMTYISK